MKKYLALYCAPAEVMEQWTKSSPEDQKKGMDEWMAWGEMHKDDLVEFGNPLGKNTRITKAGVTDVSNEIGGWSIVHAASAEEAAKIFDDSPHFNVDGTYIELMPLADM